MRKRGEKGERKKVLTISLLKIDILGAFFDFFFKNFSLVARGNFDRRRVEKISYLCSPK